MCTVFLLLQFKICEPFVSLWGKRIYKERCEKNSRTGNCILTECDIPYHLIFSSRSLHTSSYYTTQLQFQALITIFQYACFCLIPTSTRENEENNFFQITTAPLAKIKVFLKSCEWRNYNQNWFAILEKAFVFVERIINVF